MKQLGGMDANFLNIESSTTYGHVSSLTIFEPEPGTGGAGLDITKRAILSRMRPERQERVLFVWEKAIEQTGGYFYSRLLLSVINGFGMYLVLRLNNVPFAAPLAIFEGIVAEFIPIVGTYIGGAAPILVACAPG